MLFGLNSTDWSDAFMSHAACAPSLLRACTRHVSLMPEIFSTLLCRNTELQEKTFIWLQWQKKCKM